MTSKNSIMLAIFLLLELYFFATLKSCTDYYSCTYQKEIVIGIVSDKESHTELVNSIPVIYSRVYSTKVILSDGFETVINGSIVYNACDIGDEILIEAVYKYKDDYLVSIDYKTVNSKTEFSITQEKQIK